MSLLLDALKKAADDKSANTNKPAHSNSPHTDSTSPDNSSNDLMSHDTSTIDETVEENLDLNLNLIPEDTKTDKEVTEDFPEVDESVILKAKTASTIEIQPEEADLNPSNKFSDKFDNHKAQDLEVLPLELPNQGKLNKIIDSPMDNIEPETISDEISSTKDAPDSLNYSHAESSIEQRKMERINNEQALSALINKSNKLNRSQKIKNYIALILFIIMSVTGSALYLYVESESSNQTIYIASIASPIGRDSNKQKITVNTEKNPKKLLASQQELISKPETRQPVKQEKSIPSSDNSSSQITNKLADKSIKIIHTKKIDPIHVLLRNAYDAFINREYHQSAELYKKALQREAKNRDALLGLAAIATKQQRFESARQKYRYLIRLNPKDSIATAGLSSLDNHANPHLSESRLNFMLKNQPDSAHLYFALGSQYSTQKKWAEAQSAYFKAWSAENKNADYAYNLAVSLDHLDKKKQALEFYKLSLELNQVSSGNFSNTETQNRIKALQESRK